MSTFKDINFQDSASPLMEHLMYFHDHSMFIITIILFTIGYMIASLMLNNYSDRFMMDSQALEIIWTILPAITLLFIAFPSLHILYLIDENPNSLLTVKTLGHQWYWSYEYSDFKDFEFDAFMIPQDELNQFNIRLLEVDNRIALPQFCWSRMLITSEDVIHSWTIPSIAIKADATPGRLNQASVWLNRPGVFYGQCSEICGANHSFMPIVIESLPMKEFFKWLSTSLN
nr:cytochrome c oxidase subunit II [Carrikerella sp.]